MPTEPVTVPKYPGRESNSQPLGFKPNRSAIGVPGPHRNRVGEAGIEPAETCAQGTWATITLHPESTQRESNPHIRHGKAVGCRYIMGAKRTCRIVKELKEHREGVEPSLPPTTGLRPAVPGVRSRGLWTTSASGFQFSGTRGARTLTCLVKSQVCCH